MPTSVERVIRELTETTDGLVAHKKVKKLYKLAAQGDETSFQGLVAYMQFGKIDHVRTYVCSLISEMMNAQRCGRLVDIFRRGLADNALRYWSVDGLALTAGSDSYKDLCAIALNEDCRLDERAKALQTLARTSLQPFNRGLNSDPGYWEEKDLRLDELKQWQDAGFPQGAGLPQPARDPALDNPQTDFEKVISDFDSRLARYRANDPDEKTNPSNYLAAASKDDMEAVKRRWSLPKKYLTFLERFSPYNMTCELQLKFASSGFDLYSANTILENQAMFAIDPTTGENDSDWPENYVVIGDAWLDPFALDLSKCDENDGPIFTAEHGIGEWSFRKYAKSFEALLQKLKVT
jgi:hypothetical protein